ncbi:protein ALP1-like [Solenopsis invicta]|uniref:protein ALP1-like n=1 Tax=Solenopsis invicta TaxID=13686 RepID=UPI00193E8BE2|nr:protein ALP1-like [Solenopsis invicta]
MDCGGQTGPPIPAGTHSDPPTRGLGCTTVSNIISETCEVIWNELCPIVLPPSLSKKDWKSIAADFDQRCDFPHCIGAIDGKHIVIQCPNNAGSMYYNYKHSHSIVLMAVCDANYMFTFVDIGAYGRRSDGGIFKECQFGKKFEQNKMNVPEAEDISRNGPKLPYCLVGDEAFPLKEYLLRPYSGRGGLTKEKNIFNYRLSRARRVIENTFGILACQWRILRKPIIGKVETVERIVQSIVCLHNWLRKQDINKNEYITTSMIDHDGPNGFIPGSWRMVVENGSGYREVQRAGAYMSTRKSMEVRENFCEYFNNDGSVSWQDDYA